MDADERTRAERVEILWTDLGYNLERIQELARAAVTRPLAETMGVLDSILTAAESAMRNADVLCDNVEPMGEPPPVARAWSPGEGDGEEEVDEDPTPTMDGDETAGELEAHGFGKGDPTDEQIREAAEFAALEDVRRGARWGSILRMPTIPRRRARP